MGASQATKLGLKPGARVVLDHAPDGWALLDPPAVDLVEAGSADVVISFIRTRAELQDRVEAWAEAIHPAGSLWIAWPRRAAGHVSDVTDNAVRECTLARGLVDVKVAAIDDDWSGLKFVWRRKNR